MRNISWRSQFIPLIIPLFLSAVSGCNSHNTAPAENYLTLETYRASALKNHLGISTVESVKEVAGELEGNHLRLSIPALIAELRQGKSYLIEYDPRLRLLRSAMEYLILLRKNPTQDAVDCLRPWTASQIKCKSACAWAELAALEQLTPTAEREQTIRNIRLSLALMYGVNSNNLPPFDFSTLADPEFIPPYEAELQEFSRVYSNDPAASLRFAELLFRLPDELRRRELADDHFDARGPLGAALNIAAEQQIAISSGYLTQAYNLWQKAVEELKKNWNSSELQEKEIFAKLRWRKAFYHYEMDSFALMSSPPAAHADRTFIFDLAILQ